MNRPLIRDIMPRGFIKGDFKGNSFIYHSFVVSRYMILLSQEEVYYVLNGVIKGGYRSLCVKKTFFYKPVLLSLPPSAISLTLGRRR